MFPGIAHQSRFVYTRGPLDDPRTSGNTCIQLGLFMRTVLPRPFKTFCLHSERIIEKCDTVVVGGDFTVAAKCQFGRDRNRTRLSREVKHLSRRGYTYMCYFLPML